MCTAALWQIRRVTKVVKGGKQLSFRAVVVAGDGEGSVGVGCSKAKEVRAPQTPASPVPPPSHHPCAGRAGQLTGWGQGRKRGVALSFLVRRVALSFLGRI